MAWRRLSRHFRVGLQLKSVLVLAFVVIGVTMAGGWFYFANARASLRSTDHRHAVRMARAVGLAAQRDLWEGRRTAAQRLVSDFVRNENVYFVALLDAEGRTVAAASKGSVGSQWLSLIQLPVTVSTTTQVSEDVLTLACPIVARNMPDREGELVGAVRLVIDTSPTTRRLARVQQRMSIVASAIVICAIPLGYLLVWRLILQPIRRLANQTRRLGGGDFSARARFHRADEIGQLGEAFDAMVREVARMRDKLVVANERLEQEVAERTKELQVANRRLREEMAEKEDFLRAVSHDLNAPLRNIAGMATMIMMKWKDALPEDALARLQRIQANVDSEQSLIAELLELSRIKSRPETRTVVDMRALMEDVARTFEYELKSRNIELAITGGMPGLYVEKNRMRQVFQNLLDNAIKYMHRTDGGRIEIGWDYAEGMHLFTVWDNGPGIPREEQEKIFFVFRRAASAAAGRTEGKGVGLAWVKSVVANYDGRVWVDSTPGEGATFTVALSGHATKIPDKQEAAATPQAADAQEAPEEDARHDGARADYHPVGG